MTDLLSIAMKRLKNRGFGNAFQYAASRFNTVRALRFFHNRCFGRIRRHEVDKSIFQGVTADEILNRLGRDAFFSGLNIPDAPLREIINYARQGKCSSHLGEKKYEYIYSEKNALEKKIGKKFILAHYENPSASCPAIAGIQNDPLIMTVTSRFLGTEPRVIDSRLWWSFATEAPEQDRLKSYQTVLFHYDLESYLFIYFNFYLTDVDSSSGPHVVVRGSHRRKKAGFLFSSANQSDEAIVNYYGADSIMPLYGKAGWGFVEDAFCFHKALPPASKDRLFLQIRMSA